MNDADSRRPKRYTTPAVLPAPSVETVSNSTDTSEIANEDLDAERRRLADRLKETREFLGLSQQEVADTAGLTRVVISAIETGRRKVESVELSALARVYGQPVTYFLSPDQDVNSQPEEVRFIARAARELAPEDRAELLRFAEFLKGYRAPRTTTVAGHATPSVLKEE